MAPKAKARGKAAAKAKPKAAMRVAMRRVVARRPAGAPAVLGAPGVLDRWRSGEEVGFSEIGLEELGRGVKIVVTKGSYYTAECQAAGTLDSMTVESGEVHLGLKLSGTTNESLLRYATGQAGKMVRCHRCTPLCTGERVSDDLLHVSRMRLMRDREEEDGWTHNLVIVDAGEDDLREVRARAEAKDEGIGGKEERGLKEKTAKSRSRRRRSHERGRSKKKKTKGKRRKKKKEKDQASRSSGSKKRSKKEKAAAGVKARSTSSSSSSTIKLDGRHARGAAIKPLAALYGGTGLDPKERIRVAKKSKSGKSSGSSRSSGASEDTGAEEVNDLGLFDPETRLQRVAELYPGVLTAQALKGMRASLLQSIGSDDQSGPPQAISLAYYRQQLQRRASGPAQRELITICAALDALMKGAASKGTDVLCQRLKSIEAVMSGTHWSVAQRLEISPQEAQVLAAKEELSGAQKEAYDDSKVRYLSSLQDGRKGKSKGKERESTDHNKGKGKQKSGKSGKEKKDEQVSK